MLLLFAKHALANISALANQNKKTLQQTRDVIIIKRLNTFTFHKSALPASLAGLPSVC